MRVLDLFKTLGGGYRNVDFGPENLEARLVELGFESPYMNPETKTRKRKDLRNAKTSRRHSHEQMMNSEGNTVPTAIALTEEEQEELYRQVDSRMEAKAEPVSPGNSDAMELGYEDEGARDGGSQDFNASHSARVAMQACHELMREDPYAAHRRKLP